MDSSVDLEVELRQLTQRQCQILYWVCKGWIFKQVARQIGFGEDLVTAEMSQIYRLFGLTKRPRAEKRYILVTLICPLHERLVDDPRTDCEQHPIEVGKALIDPETEREVAEDAKGGLIPLDRALVYIGSPPTISPEQPPPGRGGLQPRPYPPTLLPNPPKPKGTALRDLLLGVLVTLLVLTLCVLGIVVFDSSGRFVTLLRELGSLTTQTVDVPAQVAAVPSSAVTASPLPPRVETVLLTAPALTPVPPVVQTVLVREPTQTPANTVPPVVQTVVVTQPPVVETVVVTPLPPAATASTSSGGTNGLLPFSDDFEDGIRPEWIRAGGEWSMSNGRLRNAGERGTIWLGPADWTDYVVEADVDRDYCEGTDNNMNLMVRMQDPNNYILILLRACGNEGIYVVREGQDTLELVRSGTSGEHFKVEVRGQIIRVEIDGQPIWSASNEYFASGGVGFRTSGPGTLDNISVQPSNP